MPYLDSIVTEVVTIRFANMKLEKIRRTVKRSPGFVAIIWDATGTNARMKMTFRPTLRRRFANTSIMISPYLSTWIISTTSC